MGIFQNLTTENLEQAEDRLGGGFEPLPSGVYDATIKLAYAGKSPSSDAQKITLHLDVDGKEVREDIYITNRNGENFFKDKNDPSKKIPLPGFTTIDDLCLLVTGFPLADQNAEEKTVKIYNFDERKEIPTPVPCITALHGKPVKIALLRVIEDKQSKGDDGEYRNTGETRTKNEIDKIFHAETGMTVNEYRQELEAPEFLPAWKEKNEGKDRNKAKGVSNGGGAKGQGRPGGAAAGGQGGSARKSLFS